MVTFAVQLRNRRKWGTPSEYETPVQSYAGVDTFQISCWVQFKSANGVCPHQVFVDSVKSQQDLLRQGKGTTAGIEVLGERISVNRAGSTKGGDGKKGPHYPYVISWRGIRFELQPFGEATGSIPNVVVYASSTPLIAKRADWSAVWDEARYFLEAVLLGQITQTAVGRLDVFTDQPGQVMAEYFRAFYAACFVRRSRKWSLETVGQDVQAEVVRGYLEASREELAVRIDGNGQRITGLTLGRSGVKCRIYDKLVEMETKEDFAKFEAMRAAYWGGSIPKELVRVEFQMNSRQLREAGITDVQSLRRELRNVAGWLCNSWVTVRQDGFSRKHARDAELHPYWAGVVNAVASRFGRDWDRRPVARPPLGGNDVLLDQALGCLLSRMARGDFPGSPEELLEKVDQNVIHAINRVGLNRAFEKCKAKVEDYHARVAAAFLPLERRSPTSSVDALVGTPDVGPADYSAAPGGRDGHGPDAPWRPDAALAMSAMGDDATDWTQREQWEFWRRTYRGGGGS